jgi:hypothetical protein
MDADALERRFTLATAVARYDRLRARDTLAAAAADLADPAGSAGAGVAALSREESLEMLALGVLIAHKAGYGRQLGVRSAREAGASWSQIGAALGTSKQSAWEAHMRWIDEQALPTRTGHQGLGKHETAAARKRAGSPDS